MSMIGGFLREPAPEHFAHSRVSAQFAAQPALQNRAKLITTFSAPTTAAMTEATQRWEDAIL